MIKHTVEGRIDHKGKLVTEPGNISMGVDLNTGELVVESQDETIRIPFSESKELIGLIRQKQAIYEDLERKKKGWWERSFGGNRNWE